MNWSRITEDQAFHELMNALLRDELGPKYIPGIPKAIADGGWDGKYEGALTAILGTDAVGTVMVQAKFTERKLTAGFRHLRTELQGSGKGEKRKIGEIEKARRENADVLLLCTNAPLGAADIDALQRLGKSKGQVTVVWAREQLQNRIEPNSWLAARYLGSQRVPSFVPEAEYRDGSERVPQAPLAFVGRDNDLHAIAELLRVDGNGIVVVHGPGGVGKTALAREVVRRAGALKLDQLFRFVLPGAQLPQDMLHELPPSHQPVVLCIDDADRRLAVLDALVGALRAAVHPQLKLLVLSRTGGHHAVVDHLRSTGAPEPHILGLEPLSDKDIDAILACAGVRGPHADSIRVATRGNLFLLAYVMWLIKHGGPTLQDHQRLLATVMDRYQQDAGVVAHKIDLHLGADVLPVLAALSPFDPTSPDVHRLAASLAGIPSKDLTRLVPALRRAQVLRALGRLVRFDADMAGDLILTARISALDGPEFMTRLLAESAPCTGVTSTVLSNLASVAGFGDKSTRCALDAHVGGWLREIHRVDNVEILRNLETLARIAQWIPLTALEYVVQAAMRSAADHPPLEATERHSIGWARGGRLSLDQMGPVLLAAGSNSEGTAVALGVLADLERYCVLGNYSNYRPDRIAEQLANGFIHSGEVIDAALAAVDRLLTIGTPGAWSAQVLEGALGALLAAAHQYTRARGATMTIVMEAVPVHPSLLERRARALLVVLKGLVHESRGIRLAAIRVIRTIGSIRHMPARSAEVPLGGHIDAERRQGFAAIGERLHAEKSRAVLAQCEDVLFSEWVRQGEFADLAARALRRSPRELCYRVFLKVHGPVCEVPLDFPEYERAAQETDRSEWHFDRRTHNRNAEIPQLAEEIATTFPSAEKFLDLLKGLESEGADAAGYLTYLLERYDAAHPEVLDALVFESRRRDVPATYLSQLDRVMIWRSEAAFERLMDRAEATMSDPIGAAWCQRIVNVAAYQYPGHLRWRAILERLAVHPDDDVRSIAVHQSSVLLPTAEERITVFAKTLALELPHRLVEHVLMDVTRAHASAYTEDHRARVRVAIATSFPKSRTTHLDDFGQLVQWACGDDHDAYVALFAGRMKEQLRAKPAYVDVPTYVFQWIPLITRTERAWALVTQFRVWYWEGLFSEYYFHQLADHLGGRVAPEVRAAVLTTLLAETPLDGELAARFLDGTDITESLDSWRRVVVAVRGTKFHQTLLGMLEHRAGWVGEWHGEGDDVSVEHRERAEYLREQIKATLDIDIRGSLIGALDHVERTLRREKDEHEEQFGS